LQHRVRRLYAAPILYKIFNKIFFMTATIKPLGMLKSYIGNVQETEVEAGSSIRQALINLGINPDLVAGVFVNDEQQSKEYVLQDGDMVKLLAVIGGG
jgi:sulfur carrier protein ThiS